MRRKKEVEGLLRKVEGRVCLGLCMETTEEYCEGYTRGFKDALLWVLGLKERLGWLEDD